MSDALPEPMIHVRTGAATHPGRVRDHNEDRHLVAAPVFIVADGMGGHSRGDVAAEAALAPFRRFAGRVELTSDMLQRAVSEASASVRAIASDGRPPGSTLAGVGISAQEGRACWLVFNLGDSRVYRLGAGRLEQVSVDHSRVQELMDHEGIDRGAAARRANSNIITRALGAGTAIDPMVDQWLLLARPGDRIAICSDGLSDEVSDLLISATLQQHPHPQDAADALVGAALAAGGRDNITVVVVDAELVEGVDSSAPPDTLTTQISWVDAEDTLPHLDPELEVPR